MTEIGPEQLKAYQALFDGVPFRISHWKEGKLDFYNKRSYEERTEHGESQIRVFPQEESKLYEAIVSAREIDSSRNLINQMFAYREETFKSISVGSCKSFKPLSLLKDGMVWFHDNLGHGRYSLVDVMGEKGEYEVRGHIYARNVALGVSSPLTNHKVLSVNFSIAPLPVPQEYPLGFDKENCILTPDGIELIVIDHKLKVKND